MPFFSGFAGRFGDELARSRSEEADRAERQSALESSVLQHLSTSPDPEIASHAITGLLDLAGPQKRAGGLGGWLGKMAQHPALPTIRQLVSGGRQVEATPPVAPTAGVQEGLSALPGQQIDIPWVTPPPAARQTLGPPSPDESAPSVLTPPPAPRSTPGTPFQPATMKTVPRQVFESPEQIKGQTTYLETQGKLKAEHEAYQAASPEERQTRYMGGYAPPAVQHTTDAQGNVRFFRNGEEISSTDAAGQPKTPPRASAPEAQAMERAQEILAAATPGSGMTPEAALAQARTEGRAKTVAAVQAASDAHQVRLGQIQAMVPATIAAWQRVNGTVPMTRAQAAAEASRALSAARQTLGGGPDVTPEDITRFADGLMAASDTQVKGPKVSPTRAALAQPLAVPSATPPPGLTGALTTAAPSLAGAATHPRAYSQQGKRTVQAINTARPMLEQLVAEIKANGLENDGNAVGTGLQALMQKHGFSPGQLQTELLQLSAIPEVAQMQAVSSGRVNIKMMDLLQGHLTDPGDSYKLLYDKANGLLKQLPVMQQAVDAAESAQVGARGGGGKTTPPPTKSGGPAAGSIPPAVQAALKGLPAGKHTLSDGSIWLTDATGTITKGG